MTHGWCLIGVAYCDIAMWLKHGEWVSGGHVLRMSILRERKWKILAHLKSAQNWHRITSIFKTVRRPTQIQQGGLVDHLLMRSSQDTLQISTWDGSCLYGHTSKNINCHRHHVGDTELMVQAQAPSHLVVQRQGQADKQAVTVQVVRDRFEA